MGKCIETKQGKEKLLQRYLELGVTDQTKDATNTYEAKWITAIKYAIENDLAMDEIDYDNTPKELRKCWRGLK